MLLRTKGQRPGAIIPLTAVCMVVLLSFVALALDMGLLMIARNQCQNTADAAATAGARVLTGDQATNNNYDGVAPVARTAAAANKVLGTSVNPVTQLAVTIGSYYYDTATTSFKINPTGRPAGENWTLVQATVTAQPPTAFAQVLGMGSFNARARATAAHRPRDNVIVVDFSGSMRFESMLAGPHGGARLQSMNPDTVYPTWGHYAGNSSYLKANGDYPVASGEVIGESNIGVPTDSALDAVISKFYADTAAFGTTTPAFTKASDTYASAPGGDVPLKTSKGGGSSYARTVSDHLGGTTSRDWRFELDGYAAYRNGSTNATTSAATDYAGVPFNGYTQGPGYWGKTFFAWPPDPRIPLTTAFYTSNASLSSPGQIQSIVKQFMLDFGFNSSNVNSTSDNSTNYVWKNWTTFTNESSLRTYLTGTLALSATDVKVVQLLRLYNRGGPGMPRNGSGVAVPADWRARFFLTTGGTPLMDSTKLWDASESPRPPRTGSSGDFYRINYAAVLDWIKNCGPNPFPNQLRAGGIVYYTAIPSTIDTNTFPPADPNQRFWKEYIDEVLGVQQTSGSGSTPVYSDTAAYSGYGDDFLWGTTDITGPPTGWPASTYMRYTDNPMRPKLRGWFGPLSLVDFIGNYNAADPSNNHGPRLWWPGTVPETPTYQTKLAIQAALKDLTQNHPNDNVAMVYFSSPRSSATATGYYNMARYPMGRDARLAINALWFSPKVITTDAEISVYNSSGVNPGDIYDVPRANGGTCYSMGLMLAHNQFSANPALVNYTKNALTGTAGGLGRHGAAKMLIFESDGCVNTGASAPYVSSSSGQGYYKVRLADANDRTAAGSEFPTGVSGVSFSVGATQSQNLATQMCADVSAGGFSTTRKPVKIHCIAFGSLFEAGNTSASKTNALSNLAALEVIGRVQNAGATTLAANKIITGDYNSRITNLQAAFGNIMQDGVQVALLSSGPGEP